jgi:hypothetical protein
VTRWNNLDKVRQSIVLYLGEDMGEVTNPPPVDTLAGQSEHVMAVGGRLIAGPHGVTGAQYINAAYNLPNKQTNNAKFTNTGTIITIKKYRAGDTYGLWGGVMGRKEKGAAMEASAPARGTGA